MLEDACNTGKGSRKGEEMVRGKEGEKGRRW
jgi:hypothetical protein